MPGLLLKARCLIPTLNRFKCCFQLSHKYYDSALECTRLGLQTVEYPFNSCPFSIKSSSIFRVQNTVVAPCQSTNRREKPVPPECAQTAGLLLVTRRLPRVKVSACVNSEIQLLSRNERQIVMEGFVVLHKSDISCSFVPLPEGNNISP